MGFRSVNLGRDRDAHETIEKIRAEAETRAAKRRITRGDPFTLLPHDSGIFDEKARRVFEDARKLVTEAGERMIDVVRSRQDGPEMRKLASFSEEYRCEIEKYAEALKQSQTEWQKEAGNIIHDILKVGDNAVELYEAFQEYPFSDNFKDYSKDKEAAANKRDYRMSLINQAIALYYCNNLKDIDKLKITDKPEFKEAQHFSNTLKAKMRDKIDMHRAAAECKRQAELAQFQRADSQKRNEEGQTHSEYIQGLPDRIGQAGYAKRHWVANKVKGYSEQAEARARELENVLAHVERHRQDTEAKFGAYISQAQKRSNAYNESIERHASVNGMLIPSTTRATNATIRTTSARNRATATPIGDTTYKDIADRIRTRTITVADNMIIANLGAQAGFSRARARQARARARQAEARARQAEARARQAEVRAKIAKAYNDPAISDEAANNVEKSSKNIEKIEKQVVKNAYLIELNEKNIQDTLTDINVKIREMRGIVTNAARAGGFTAGDRNNLRRLANEIEKAETAKNRSIAFDLQSTIKEQIAIENIRDALQEEFIALGREQNNAQRITDLATVVTQDINVLQNLVNQQRTLEETLRGTPGGPGVGRSGLIERERDESQAARAIEQAILNREPNLANVATPTGGRLNLKARELTRRQRVEDRRTEFARALTNVMRAERAVAEALKRNAIHMELDVTGDADQAIKRLQKIKDQFADQDDEKLKNMSKGHLFIDPKVGKFTLNNVWIGVREIDGWEKPDSASPGQTCVRYRPDITEVTINRLSRDAGRDEKFKVDTKRLVQQDFIGEDYHAILSIPGNDFITGNRREKGIAIICKREKDGTGNYTSSDPLQDLNIQELYETGGIGGVCARLTALSAEHNHNITIKTIDMRAARRIAFNEVLINEKRTVEIGCEATEETMPDPVINHEQALALREGEGWSDEQKRYMWKVDLDSRVLRHIETGQEYSIDEFDWTETKWDEENGLTLQFKGPRELSQLNLLAAGSSGIFSEKLSNAITALKKKKRENIEKCIEWLKQSIRSYDEHKIDNAFVSLQTSEELESYQSSMTKHELERPPKNRLDLEKLRKKKKAQKDARTPKWMAASLEGTADMLMARQSYESKVKEHIQTIHKKNPLSAEYVWKSRARPDIYSIQKHTSSKKKQKLLDEIRAANHLDKTVSFRLLEDPKQGPTSVVKNAAPNGLELLQEYNRYKDKQDFANEAERQNVEHYVANIAMAFMNQSIDTNQSIDPYYANQWNFERAIEAVTRGEILSKVVNGRNIIGASDYIRNLKQVDCPPDSDDNLAGLRQADEYHWVTYLLNGLAEASAESLAEVLQKSIPVALWMQRFRYGNLKRAEKALDLETTSDKAKLIIDDIDIIATPLPWSEFETEEKAKVDIDKDKTPFDPKAIKKKSDKELTQDASEKAGQIYKNAVDSIDRLINSIDDPALQKRYREEAVKMAMDLAKQAFEINKQDQSIQNQWHKLEELVKVMDSQRWKDLWRELFLLWLKSSVESGSKGAKQILDEFEKIVMKAVVG